MLYERIRELSAPATVHIEFVSSCNEKCRHCYNFWREENAPANLISRENVDKIIDAVQQAGVFHVILTGGEPLINYKQVLYAAQRLTDAGISISLNSNLILATEDKMKALRDAGLTHVLTSIISHDPQTHDFIASSPGAWAKIIKGIEATLASGISITNNMVISQRNKSHVYETGRLMKKLGVGGLCGTRVSPPAYADIHMRRELQVSIEDAYSVLDQLLQVKSDFGLGVSALIPFPLCFLKDFEKYQDFAGRKCAAGTYTLSLNSNGDVHACQKEGFVAGNIFSDGLSKVWENVRPWRTEEQLPSECKECSALAECGGGCRVVGYGYTQQLSGKDNLALDPIRDEDVTVTPAMWNHVDHDFFEVAPTLRFRPESGFTLLNIRAAKNMMISDEAAQILRRKLKDQETFNLEGFGAQHRRTLAHLLKKGAVFVSSKVPEPVTKD
ncbi:radical SAM protein [Omnitrophica bacterium]|nr:radical SAM protein [Candidatus Omnitrophota bacterium]